MLVSVEPCINCGASKVSDFREYDGCLGYEAIICNRCGFIYDHAGIHPPEDTEVKGKRLQPKLIEALQAMYEVFGMEPGCEDMESVKLAREVLKQCGRDIH